MDPMGYRFGLKKSLGSWLLNHLSFSHQEHVSCGMFQKHQKSLRCPRHGYGFFKSLSWSCGFSTSELKQITGFYHFLQLRHAKRLEFLHIWPARTISTNAGFLVIITLFLGGMMEISWAIQPTLLTRMWVSLDMWSTINFFRTLFWQTQMYFSQIWNTPKCSIELVQRLTSRGNMIVWTANLGMSATTLNILAMFITNMTCIMTF